MALERSLARETAAAKVLRSTLAEYEDDPILIRDTVEGSTGLHEAIAAVMQSVMEDEIMLTGLEVMIDQLSSRKSRYERRIERQRGAIEQAMVTGELDQLRLPDALLSLRKMPGKVVVLNSEMVPARFWKSPAPVLDKTALNEVVKHGEEVPGVTLSNGAVSLTVRRS